MLNAANAIETAKRLKAAHEAERAQLDTIRRYWVGRQALPAVIPSSSPREVRIMARIARVNFCPIVVDSLSQSLFVDGFRDAKTNETSPVWDAWQANKMDARQTGLHRAAHAYGTSYAIVIPGDPLPVIRPKSPRSLYTEYADDPDWPMWALERADNNGLWKLYDEQAIYYLSEKTEVSGSQFTPQIREVWSFVESRKHNAGVVPVVRFLDQDDLDADDDVSSEVPDDTWPMVPTRGQIAPLMSIQDQVDLTTFGLLVAQWYAAFRQRYVIGWMPESESQKMKAGASQLWTFEDDSETEGGGVKVGEFGQTNLDGYIESRDASLKHAASLSQTPVHELVGELVNLSAEALKAAEAGHDRKVDERKTMLGESHEQVLRLVGKYMGDEIPENAEVMWRDTSARTFAATVDGLGKLAQMLNVPAPELWSKIPGVTQQDVERWQAAAHTGDSFQQLSQLLSRQDLPNAQS